MPGMQKWSNISLKRGVFSNDNEFYDWYNTVKLSTVTKRDITISLLNENHEPSVVWKVRECFIVSYKSGDLSSEDNGYMVESIDLAHEGIVVENEA
jgi:phage tail-like protein